MSIKIHFYIISFKLSWAFLSANFLQRGLAFNKGVDV